ncbi:MAG: ABC transporter ATP-binding protein [Planctomycetota bacterium]|nr:ABC transporter ATP-binding protein [Planctomycetota bacterium]
MPKGESEPGALLAPSVPSVVATPGAGDAEKPPTVPPVALADLGGSAAAQRQVVVRAQNVKKIYRKGQEEVHALRGVDIEIFSGEYLSIMGPSGSGKSTFFNMIGGLDKPSSGKVFIDEVDIAALDAYELAWLRCRKIGYIFQSFNIIPVMTALENVTLPMVFAGMSGDQARDNGVELLKLVGLGERVNHKPYELSGGQQQRVAIARSMANSPAIILADEPTGNLDLKTGAEIIDLLTRLKEERGVTIISATHDHKMLKKSDRIVWIRDGRIDKIELRENLDIVEGTIGGEG